MGYEYTLTGWFQGESAIDLAARLAPAPYDDRERYAAERWLRVTGRRQNFAAFGTQCKWGVEFYRALVEQLARAQPLGWGLVTITGEVGYDGKDSTYLLRSGRVERVAQAEIYHESSPWNSLYRWSHYMGREAEQLQPVDAGLAGKLPAAASVKAWVYAGYDNAAEVLENELAAAHPPLATGLARLEQYGEPYVLVGEEGLDPAAVARAVAAATATRPGCYGMLFADGAEDGFTTPVAIEGGRVLVLPGLRIG